jgi:hypothetical protein
MSTATGLTRLGSVFKGIGYVCLALAAIGAFNHFSKNNSSDGFIVFLLFGVPGAGLWLAGWVIQGFAKTS